MKINSVEQNQKINFGMNVWLKGSELVGQNFPASVMKQFREIQRYGKALAPRDKDVFLSYSHLTSNGGHFVAKTKDKIVPVSIQTKYIGNYSTNKWNENSVPVDEIKKVLNVVSAKYMATEPERHALRAAYKGLIKE